MMPYFIGRHLALPEEKIFARKILPLKNTLAYLSEELLKRIENNNLVLSGRLLANLQMSDLSRKICKEQTL
jgi:hypothetical protein